VLVLRHGEGVAFFGNLYTCGSVWVCAVCAAKITEKRRLEMVAAVEGWQAVQGHRMRFLTLTGPHYAPEYLAAVLNRLTRARRKLRDGKAYGTATRSAGIVGGVRALEVTHGVHGWHPHTHELLFCEAGEEPDPERLLEAWKAAYVRAGGKEPNEHGVRWEDGDKAARYASKWGAAEELTKAHIKRGKNGGRTPWDLLRSSVEGDKVAGDLFKEFAHVFQGKKQLVWSKGLRDLLGLGRERSDEELAKEKTEEAVTLATLDREAWGLVLANDMRCEVLEAAEEGGAEGVARLLDLVR
jgi:hypothetical protein